MALKSAALFVSSRAMIDFHCACGAPIRMPDSAAGRRATCTTCGQKVTIPVPQAAFAGEPDFALEPDAAPPGMAAAPIPPMPPAPQPPRSQYTTSSREAFEAAREERKQRGFAGDALLAFINVVTFRSLISVGSLAVMLAGSSAYLAGAVAGSVGRSGRRSGFGLVLMSIGAVFLYAYEVIVYTAGGEDDMPAFWDIEDFREEMFSAVISLAATVGVLLVPSFIAVIAIMMYTPSESTTITILAIAFGLGVLLFPVTILAVALGGVSVLGRFDLILRTVIAAPFAYIAVLLTMAVAALICAGLVYAIATGPGASPLAVFGGAGVLLAYFSVVCAKQVGLFYRHFSDRFPWTAG